jgi:hypothetical protein
MHNGTKQRQPAVGWTVVQKKEWQAKDCWKERSVSNEGDQHAPSIHRFMYRKKTPNWNTMGKLGGTNIHATFELNYTENQVYILTCGNYGSPPDTAQTES